MNEIENEWFFGEDLSKTNFSKVQNEIVVLLQILLIFLNFNVLFLKNK